MENSKAEETKVAINHLLTTVGKLLVMINESYDEWIEAVAAPTKYHTAYANYLKMNECRTKIGILMADLQVTLEKVYGSQHDQGVSNAVENNG